MTLEATLAPGSANARPAFDPDAASGTAAVVDPMIRAARTGTPVEQGAALRTLDGLTGDRRLTEATVADAAPPGARPAEQCAVDVRFNPVVGPTHHAFIVTTDGDSANYFRGGPQANNTGINSSSSRGENAAPYDPQFGVYGPIVTEYGAYRPGTVDWTTQPSGEQRVATLPGNCDGIERQLARHMDDIEAARINYAPLAANSNSTVREALERAGFPDVSPIMWAPAWNTQLPDPR